MPQIFHSLHVKLLLAFSPATLFHKISLLPWYANTLEQWVDASVDDKKLRVLDAGCATGYLTQYLYQQGHHVTGVDLSSAMIKTARKREESIDFQIADVSQLPFNDNEFDHIFSASLINIVDDAKKMLKELMRVSKKKGQLHFLFPKKDFTNEDLEKLIQQLNISGFSEAAIRAWYKFPPKMSVEDIESLLTNTAYKIRKTRTYLNDMVLAVSIHNPNN